ncbi:uncharacterized protein LOC115797156 isoform X2 [Archocentrus centrarchus]|uniref:uncharacterized protein LOC115797156 isoform X2 n=1 Tax=Archocentrus centrarchus TaxID=63155 RepID=UPI0011EA3CC2|nr:uncharacterized protein LOC115797156 isoform X2 [Archocentrus centrarchus]
MESDSANMSKRDVLRGIITERLSTAVREILAVVERTVADYEEEAADFKREIDRQRRLLELLQPEIKLEADDQQVFPLGDAGGGQLPEDWKQDKYEPSLEDSGSLGYQAPIEDDEFQYLEQEEEEDVTQLDYPMASRLFPQTVQSKGRRKEKCQSSNPTDLNIRIIENTKIRVLSSRVYRKYPVQKLKVPHGLQEAEFLDLLKSTFPQLADEPFNIFFSGKHRKLKPLNVKSLTPEEFKRAYGDSTMVIRLQREDADEDADEDPPSTPDTMSHNTRVTADETTPTSHPLTETDTHINLKTRILEDPQMDVISPIVFQSYPPHELQVPRGLQEDDFLALLRSTFPQLAAGEPFTILTAHGKKLKPLRGKTVTAEEICRTSRSTGNPVIFIRLKGPEIKFPLREVAADDPPSASDRTTPNTEIKSNRPQISHSDTHIHLKIRIMEDPEMDMTSPNLFQSYPPHELQVPRGLQEDDFLALLRSTFPQLAAGEPFTILTAHSKKLKPLTVESVTAEEIYRTSRTPGNPVIFIRLKDPEIRSPQSEAAVEDAPPTPDPTTLNTEVQSGRISPVRQLLSTSDTHVELKICILEDSDINMISLTAFQTYPVHELQCLRGLQEADFLNLLRSTFPELAPGKPLELLKSNEDGILEPLNVESLTAEEIKRAVGSAGSVTLFVRLKAPKDAQASVKNLDGAKDSPSISEQPRPHMSGELNGTLKSEAGLLNQLYQITDAIKPLDEDLRDIILRALPEISGDTQQVLIDKLLSNGLVSKQDLNCVTQEDIGDLLPAFQLQKLLESFKNETELGTVDLQTVPSPSSLLCSPATLPCSTPSSDLPLSNQESSSSENCRKALCRKEWTETFQVPWDLMPMEVQAAVAEGERPSPAAQRQMVRILVDEVRRYDLNPSRSQCVIICQKVIHRYPQSFADLCDSGQLLGEGYTSLLNQIKNRIDNLNRNKKFHNHHSSGMKRGSAYTYSHTRFKPSLPPEETNETVEQKRQRLEEIYCQDDANVAEKDEVTELMKVTFSMQRRQINTIPAPAIRYLIGRWPYLFTQNGLYTHFELLTDIKVLRTLEVAMEECGQTILELFIESTNPDVQAILSLGPNHELSFCIIQLLMAHFTEALDGLILFANASATAADVEETLQLPATPRLILLVESPGSSIHRWMISLEGSVICEGIQPTFLSGLAAVFSTYYIFNLQYQANAACTLEFIQRRFMGIIPARGTKAPQGKFLSEQTGKFDKKSTTPINPQVLTLLNKLKDVN